MEIFGVFLILFANVLLYISNQTSMPLWVWETGVAGALVSSIAYLSLGSATRRYSSALIVFGFGGMSIVFSAFFPGKPWLHPAPLDWIYLVVVGLLGLSSQFLATLSFAHLKSSIATSLSRTCILFSGVLDITLAGYRPHWLEWASYLIVIAGVDLYEKLDPFGLYLRVGIGNGGQCTTTTKATGYGRGQITEIMECVDATNTIYIIADGGISNSANAAKAFAAGANYVMLGSYFSKAKEAQNVIDGEYKCWGSASDYNMQKFGTRRRHSEGKVTEFDESEVKPLKVLVDDLWGGISSAVSYSGNDSLTSFIGNGVFEIKS
jgi:IMP dehydrogenase/GMP reductase